VSIAVTLPQTSQDDAEMSCLLAWAANTVFGVALPRPVLAPPPAPALLQPLLGVAPSAAGGLLGGSGRAKLVWEVLREGRDPFDEGSGLGQNTRAALHAHFSPPAHEMLATSVSECGTRKLLLRLPLGDEVETVIIPHRGFSTLCVSSQVGCRQGCTFCATGTMGLLRSLTADEILLQLHTASAAVREHGMPPLRNVVFMGMGEPADNVEHVTGAPHATPRHDTPHATRRHTTHDAPRGLHASKP
jgi:adenine C2-methylase RlmN of 23S rRNA A2503 and tRNA A37